jgi:hypothetical protein
MSMATAGSGIAGRALATSPIESSTWPLSAPFLGDWSLTIFAACGIASTRRTWSRLRIVRM